MCFPNTSWALRQKEQKERSEIAIWRFSGRAEGEVFYLNPQLPLGSSGSHLGLEANGENRQEIHRFKEMQQTQTHVQLCSPVVKKVTKQTLSVNLFFVVICLFTALKLLNKFHR